MGQVSKGLLDKNHQFREDGQHIKQQDRTTKTKNKREMKNLFLRLTLQLVFCLQFRKLNLTKAQQQRHKTEKTTNDHRVEEDNRLRG